MSQIDFAVAFLLMITVLTYSFLSVSNKLTNDFNTFTAKKLEKSASSLSKQLFEIQDNKSLISNFKKIQVSFIEIGGYQHTETMNVTITPVVGKIHVYDNFLNETSSTNTSDGNNITISFNLGFSPNEKKYINIIYDDIPTNKITYTSNITTTNVTSIILSEEDYKVLSQDKCSILKSLSYEEAKNQFGFSDNFESNITECEYGGKMPSQSNIIVKSVPLIIEQSNGTLYSNFVKLKVW
jgi:hypothetical protein